VPNRDPTTPTPPPEVVVLDGTCPLTPEDIGGKAWSVNRMRALGLPVPPAIVITTQACRAYYANGRVVTDSLWTEIAGHLSVLEDGTGRRFGAPQRPLLVSVRSGAAHSMPGMMDTVLNLGINAAVEAALAAETGDVLHAADIHRRFVAQFRKVVFGSAPEPVPVEPEAQLRAAVAAVFDSWHSPRARAYRAHRGLPEDAGTAVTIQAMVFGTLDDRSGTGVLFSRNPITGAAGAWGEWLPRAQGEEVVSGSRTPQPLDTLRDQIPEVHAALMRATATLEADARDIQDIEFTVESARLWMLQSRVAKRSPQAAVRAAIDFAEAGLISTEDALRRLTPDQVRQLPSFDLSPRALEVAPVAIGEGACPGVVSGRVVTDPDDAEARARRGEDVILARPNTSPEDLHGIIAARGLVTEQGGSTSHAAVVSRELGRPCVVGCGSDTVTALAGRQVTLDGTRGRLWMGDLAVARSGDAVAAEVRILLEWGRPLIPIALLGPAEAPGDVVDLDPLCERWREALAHGIAVRGSVLETDAGIRAAMAAGVRAAVVLHPLPALLACLHAARSGPSPAARTAPAAGTADIPDLALLRLISLKGRASPALLADALALPPEVADADCAHLEACGWCVRAGEAIRLTHEGQVHLESLLAAERGGVDPAAAAKLHDSFRVLNVELKEVMTDWQVRRDGALNDHLDPDHDAAVLQRLSDLHGRAGPFMRRMAALVPRLAVYPARLDRALARIEAGDRTYLARILADSYHTVWFELHKELITLAGVNPATEARAGQAG